MMGLFYDRFDGAAALITHGGNAAEGTAATTPQPLHIGIMARRRQQARGIGIVEVRRKLPDLGPPADGATFGSRVAGVGNTVSNLDDALWSAVPMTSTSGSSRHKLLGIALYQAAGDHQTFAPFPPFPYSTMASIDSSLAAPMKPQYE
jgi:hypothetical protein